MYSQWAKNKCLLIALLIGLACLSGNTSASGDDKGISTAKAELGKLNHSDSVAAQEENNSPPKQQVHSYGSGFFVSDHGHILTNNHVVAGCDSITTRDGKPVRIVDTDSRRDLALLKAEEAPRTVATFRSGTPPKIGDSVIVFGFPLQGLLSSEGNVTTGILSATSGLQDDVRFVQITAPVQPGNSGGPLLDSSGHVIGVIVSTLDVLKVASVTGNVAQNVNFAVHWAAVRAFLDEQAVPYRKEPSQRALSTREVAALASDMSVALDCYQEPPLDEAKVAPPIECKPGSAAVATTHNFAALSSMLGKSMNNPQVKTWLSELGVCTEALIDRFNDSYYYNFKSEGISLRFDNRDDELTTIFLYSEGADRFRQYQGDLPFGLSFQLTRKEVESILGPPEESGGDGVIDFWTSYRSKRIGVTYDGKRTDDLNLRIRNISIQ
jgi:S1-C subfamily serine protease